MIFHEGRTPNYQGTITMGDPEDMMRVQEIRKMISDVNKFHRETGKDSRFYVKLQGRGPRLGNRRYNQSLPLQFARTADIYIYERR